MRRTILSEDERSRILNLHKKAILVENPPQVSSGLSPMDADKYGKIMGDIKGQMGGDLSALSEKLEFVMQIVSTTRGNDQLKKAILPELEKIYKEVQQMSGNPNNKPVVNPTPVENEIPSCESVLKAGDAPGDSPKVSMNGEVVVSNFIDGGPRYNGITFNVNGKPFCRVAISSIGDCKFQSGDPDAPGTSPSQKFTGEVTLSHFIDGGPSNESWSIYNNGKYFCKFR